MSSLPSSASTGKESGLRVPSNGKTIYHRPINRTKTSELSQASFAFLFSEMVAYAQKRVKGIQELEHKSVHLPANLLPLSVMECLSQALRLRTDILYDYLGSMFRATPSASSFSTFSSTANPRARSYDPRTLLLSSTSSSRTYGCTCLAGKPTGWKSRQTPKSPTST
jgi:hypothetical protein